MNNIQYTINLSNDNDSTAFALPNNSSFELQIKKEEGTPRRFILATDLWKALGADKAKKADVFLRSEHGKEQMLVRLQKAYGNDDLGITLRFEEFKNQDKKSLPKNILDHFVLTTRGRNGGTWMEEDLFLTYAMWISPELHALAVDCLKRFGAIETATPDRQTELLVQEARKSATRAELSASYDDIEIEDLNRKDQAKILFKVSARISQLETTGKLKDLIKLTWGASDERIVASIFSTIFGVINRVLLCNQKADLADKLGVSKNSYSRDMLTAASLNAICSIEAELCTYLQDCIDDEVVPSLDEFTATTGQIAKETRKRIFFRNGKTSRLIAENQKFRSTSTGEKGHYKVELTADGSSRTLFKG